MDSKERKRSKKYVAEDARRRESAERLIGHFESRERAGLGAVFASLRLIAILRPSEAREDSPLLAVREAPREDARAGNLNRRCAKKRGGRNG